MAANEDTTQNTVDLAGRLSEAEDNLRLTLDDLDYASLNPEQADAIVTKFDELIALVDGQENERFAIPDQIGGARPGDRRVELHLAAQEKAKHLGDAEAAVAVAKAVVHTVQQALVSDDYQSEWAADTTLEAASEALDRVHDHLDKHGREYANLFIAHFDEAGRQDFHEKHYDLLTGMIGTTRKLWLAIHDERDNEAAEDLSCALDRMASNLREALDEAQ